MISQSDREKIKNDIALVLEKVKEADPLVLNEYRALFKKEVSFFRRSWAAAYLLMCADRGSLGRIKHKNQRAESRGGGRQYPLDEKESKRLFISIGRNRRVSPREILGLIHAKAGTPREDIGAIRILDNYLFVQVRENAAENIISALNGCNFRGRTLTVNYAKNHTDEDYAETTNAGSRNDSDFSQQDQNQSDKENI